MTPASLLCCNHPERAGGSGLGPYFEGLVQAPSRAFPEISVGSPRHSSDFFPIDIFQSLCKDAYAMRRAHC